jgi:hypothetical protein
VKGSNGTCLGWGITYPSQTCGGEHVFLRTCIVFLHTADVGVSCCLNMDFTLNRIFVTVDQLCKYVIACCLNDVARFKLSILAIMMKLLQCELIKISIFN